MTADILDLDDLTYFARPELSQSGMKMLLRPGGPARFRYWQEHPQPYRDEFDFGHAAHTLVTGKGTPTIVIPDELLAKNGATSTKAAQEFIAEARKQGCTPLKRTTYERVEAMADAIQANPLAHAMLTHPEARTELAVVGVIDGIPVRGKVDLLLPDRIVDYKTAQRADVDSFSRSVTVYGYDVQAWIYTELVRQAIGEQLPFSFVVQEKEPPYLVNVIRLSDTYFDLGAQRAADAIRLFKACTASGEWPGYAAQEVEVDPPLWAFEDDIDIEIPED